MAREISLTGGGPWGFTLSGGKDFGAPLKVSKVNELVYIKRTLVYVHLPPMGLSFVARKIQRWE